MNKEKLILPTSIIIGAIILGGFYYVTQVNNQKKSENELADNTKVEEEINKQEGLEEEINQSKERNEEDNIDAKADDYIVVDKDEKKLTWDDLDNISLIIKSESIPKYDRMLKNVKKEQENIDKMIRDSQEFLAAYSNDEDINTLHDYLKIEKEANEELISALNKLIDAENALLESINKRNEDLYYYYFDRVNNLEKEMKRSLNDYLEKEKDRQEKATEILNK